MNVKEIRTCGFFGTNGGNEPERYVAGIIGHEVLQRRVRIVPRQVLQKSSHQPRRSAPERERRLTLGEAIGRERTASLSTDDGAKVVGAVRRLQERGAGRRKWILNRSSNPGLMAVAQC